MKKVKIQILVVYNGVLSEIYHFIVNTDDEPEYYLLTLMNDIEQTDSHIFSGANIKVGMSKEFLHQCVLIAQEVIE